ncbi:hypothetical protein NM688_g273 [Phlebia brevispora]|uniref:Uncharacterized protein n=1 Tax=Phlebia brevispora TaxID=194682 RepID=A0ACC1TEY3_9APHY|nr:hypothetical protein NM688_g273 [Phlebia brevispora]
MPAIMSKEPCPSLSEIRARGLLAFGKLPCQWQAQVAERILQRGDVVLNTATGSGKTLSFWLPLLFNTSGIQLVITPLNLLGQQNVAELAAAGISAIAIDSDSATGSTFQDIQDGKHRVIITSPEQLMKSGGGFERLFKDVTFRSRLISVVFDEAHCISQWGTFRPEYRQVHSLRYLLPDVPFLVASATLPSQVFRDVVQVLELNRAKLLVIRRPTDRPNIHLAVKRIEHALHSFQDLAFLVPGLGGWPDGDHLPPKFVVFCDSITDSVNAARYLRSRLPPPLRNKIMWFHSEMTNTYKAEVLEKLKSGEIWGLCATDAFGMGIDLPDICLVIQWRVARVTMCALWQRLGRGGRNQSLEATAIVFVEAKYFDTERQRKEARKRSRREKTNKRKRKKRDDGQRDEAREGGELHGQEEGDSDVELEDAPGTDENRIMDPDEVPGGLLPEEILEARKLLYAEQARQEKSNGMKRKQTDQLDMELDDFINADIRGLQCRRNVVRAFLGSDKADSDSHLCNPSHAAGCSRCAMNSSRLCCDLHSPRLLCTLPLPDLPQPTPTSKRSRIDIKYTAQPVHMQLKCELNEWWDIKTKKRFPPAWSINIGPSLVLPNEILKRIVDCTNAGKIKSVADLQKETKWADSEASEIVEIILPSAACVLVGTGTHTFISIAPNDGHGQRKLEGAKQGTWKVRYMPPHGA